jgi:LysM repeat protein
MHLNLNKIIHWLSILVLAGLGITSVYLVIQTRQAKPMTITPTAAPTVTPIPVSVDLPEITLSSDNLGVARVAQIHTYRPEKPRFQIAEYVVQQGDSAFSIAKKFNIKPETLLWGNAGMNPDAGSLKVGAKLKILPVDGVLHTVKEGDTLDKLQELYGVSAQKIVNFIGNDFDFDVPDQLNPGDQVIIPGGKSKTAWVEPAGPSVTLAKGGTTSGSGINPLAYLYKGYFSWPVFPVLITQPFWSGHGAIDIGAHLRQPVFAAAGGTVVFADWDTTGFGNLVIIDHGNGILTYYGHNYALLVKWGQTVYQGQQISEAGSTGNSTGPHVDFRIKVQGVGYVNPIDYLP